MRLVKSMYESKEVEKGGKDKKAQVLIMLQPTGFSLELNYLAV